MKKVLMVQRIIPFYRVEFFLRLADELKKDSVELKVAHSSVEVENNSVFVYIKPTIEKNIKMLLNEKFVFSLSLYGFLKKFQPTLILTEDISNLPNGLLVLIYSKMYGCKYGILGLGRIIGKQESLLKKILKIPINLFRKNSSFFISYSSVGARYYRDEYGKDSISWNNSVVNPADITQQELSCKYSSEDFNIIYIGRIERFKKLDLLIDALIILNNPIIKLFVIGDGPELSSLQLQYQDNDFIAWLGKITNSQEKELYIRKAHLGVMPGSGGLVIQELQSYGIPVITSYSDGTEIDLIKNVNPELFIEEKSVDCLCENIGRFCDLDSEEKALIAYKAFQIVSQRYNLNAMVKITVEKIRQKVANVEIVEA